MRFYRAFFPGIVVLGAALPVLGAPAENRRPAGAPSGVEEAVGYLRDYLRLDTTNPPGNELVTARFLKNLLDRADISNDVYVSSPGRANLLAVLRSDAPKKEPPLLLLHHMDVVPADPKEWKQDPFGGAEKDGSLWGRGALDTKVTGVLHLMTLLRLKREGVPLNRDVLLLAVADEENGGRWGSQWMVEKHWERMRPGYVIDEGGFGLKGVFSYGDGVVYACAVDEKKVLGLRVTADGKSGHGSMPNSDNPNDILRRALNRMEQVFIRFGGRPPEVVRDMERRLPRLRPTPLTNAVRRNTMTVTSLMAWSGDIQKPKYNMIPEQAVATLDCRLLPTEDEDDFLEKLKKGIDDDRVRVEVIKRTSQRGAGPRDYRSPLLEALEKAVRDNDPDAAVVPYLLQEATDSRFFRARGALCYGLAPIVLNDEEYLLLHAADERVPLAGLEKALSIMYDWVKNFCATENDDAPQR